MWAILKENTANYVSLESLINTDFGKKYKLPVSSIPQKKIANNQENDHVSFNWINRVSNSSRHWQNNCTVLITKDQSSKGCQHFSIFWLVIFYLICQVRATKNARWALHWRSPWVKYYNFQNPRHTFVSQHLRNVQAKFHRNLPNFGPY